MRVLHLTFLVFCCFALFLSADAKKKRKKKKKKKREIRYPENVLSDSFCDVCQIAVHVTHKESKPWLKESGYHRKMGGFQQRLVKILNDEELCSRVTLNYYERMEIPQNKLGSTCQYMYEKLEVLLDDVFVPDLSEADAAQAVCVDNGFCEALWAPQEHASKRLTPKERGTRNGEAFLAENIKKEGWKETKSGLQYKVISRGDGTEHPEDEDLVKVNYRGTLTNGDEFDAGEDVEFGVTKVIEGWTEGLKLMREGDKFEFAIRGDLAYGDSGSGAKIGPMETLLFEVELLDIQLPKEEGEEEYEEDEEQDEFDEHEEL